MYSGGTIANTGGITATSMTISGATPALSGRLNLSGDGPHSFTSGTLTIPAGGTLALTGNGNLAIQNGAQIANGGLVDIQTDADIQHSVGAAPTFTNTGTLRKSGGIDVSTIGNPVNVTNAATGLIDVQTGTLQLSNGMPNNDGVINIGAGATLSTGGTVLVGG